jgi:hypothetical protein
MTEESLYGKLNSEQVAEENTICRKIVHEIANFGVSQRQQLLIIYLLSLELENIEYMQAITSLIKDISNNELFISNVSHDEDLDG